jgi:hypothetical protein
MRELTRRRYPERHDCWHFYFGDVHVGTIARRAWRRSGLENGSGAAHNLGMNPWIYPDDAALFGAFIALPCCAYFFSN